MPLPLCSPGEYRYLAGICESCHAEYGTDSKLPQSIQTGCCRSCGDRFCVQCASFCEDCRQGVCRGCLRMCRVCHEWTCKACLGLTATCGNCRAEEAARLKDLADAHNAEYKAMNWWMWICYGAAALGAIVGGCYWYMGGVR